MVAYENENKSGLLIKFHMSSIENCHLFNPSPFQLNSAEPRQCSVIAKYVDLTGTRNNQDIKNKA